MVNATDENQKSYKLIVPNNDYEDINTCDSFKTPPVVLRHPPQFDLNRLSNITEEDTNFEEEENKQTKDSDQSKVSESHLEMTFHQTIDNNIVQSDPIVLDNQNSNEFGEDDNVNHLDSKSVNDFKEILILGEQVSNIYKNIENELLEPSIIESTLKTNYKPSMKKRVYNIKSNLIENKNDTDFNRNIILGKSFHQNSYELKETELSECDNLLSTKFTRSHAINDKKNYKNNEIQNIFPQPEKFTQESEEDPDSILNFLIKKLSEQHKFKLSKSLEISPKKSNEELRNIKLDIENLTENDLKLNLKEKNISQINDACNRKASIKTSEPINSNDESNIVMTKSLYAQHKQINLIKDKENSSSQKDSKQQLESADKNNKIITTLSINEIETTNLFRMNTNKNSINNDFAENSLLSGNNSKENFSLTNNDEEESIAEEKKIKEEILLIGEKNDIESLLENENNELYNLIIENSNRSNKLTEIEKDLNKKRIEMIKNEDFSKKLVSKDYSNTKSFEIVTDGEEFDENSNDKNILQVEHTAKYLVNEITKLSLNKMKIDELSDKLNKKYFSNNLFTKHEILNNLLDSSQTESFINKNENQINQTREDLYDYYSNLERNLEQVRNEIDKLKKDAYDDLIYISEVLNTKEIKENLTESHLNELIDYDQVYLKNDDDNISETFENRLNNFNEIKSDLKKQMEIENDEDTQYLSQPTSINSTSASNIRNNNNVPINKIILNNNCDSSNLVKKNFENNNENSQAYLTPAESWQTLVNENKSSNSDKNNINIFKDVNKLNNDENQTDLDEDELLK